jgi:hypothetical protein
VLYATLKLKMDHPDWGAAQLAEHLSEQLGSPVNAVSVRQRLSRARNRLCELLRQQVRLELRNPTEEQVDEELAELGLLGYCRPNNSGS